MEQVVYNVGGIAASEGCLGWLPSRPTNSRFVLHLSGAGGTALSIAQATFRPLPQRLARGGIPFFSIDAGNNAPGANFMGYQWGSALAVSRIEAARTWIATTYGLKSDKMVLLGGSGGGFGALNYAHEFPARVAAVALQIGGVDINDIYTNPAYDFEASIDAALPGGYLSRSPVTFASQLTVPVKGWWSSDDPTVRKATVDAFLAAYPAAERVDLGAKGHSADTTNLAELIDYIQPHIFV